VATIVELGCKLVPGSVKVIEQESIAAFGPFKQNQPNQMIQLPDNSVHNAGLIAREFQSWESIEPINSELTQELGMPFTFVPPSTAKKPVASGELLAARIGGTAMQADGTTWKRVS
jgi:hypothetical protein